MTYRRVKIVRPPIWLFGVLATPVFLGLIWAFRWFCFELGKYAYRNGLTEYEACGHAGALFLTVSAVVFLAASIRLPAAPSIQKGDEG